MITSRTFRDVLAAAADLALGSRCAGCGSVPGTLCDTCALVLHGPALEGELAPDGLDVAGPGVQPGIGPPESRVGWPMPLAATTYYEGVGRSVVLAHKERGRLALATPLGAALAVAVTAVLAAADATMRDETPHDGVVAGGGGGGGALAGAGATSPAEGPSGYDVVLVPAPSRRSATRARGHDPMLRTARQAVKVLRRTGLSATVVPALIYRRRVYDQHELGRDARFDNVRDAVGVRGRAVRQLVGRQVVVVDDVVTTGATLTECRRALHRAGVIPRGAAAITVVGGFLR